MPLRQVVGVALLMVPPVLALGGWLGEKIVVAEVAEAGLRVRLESPACARYGNLGRMRIRVEGTPADAGRVVRIEVDADYLERFSAVDARPAGTSVEQGRLIFEQELSAEGDAVSWVFDLTPEDYGWARGSVRVTRGDGAPVTLGLATFVFP